MKGEKFLRLWAWIGQHAIQVAEESQDSLLVVKGFEDCHRAYDVLIYELVQGVDNYSSVSANIPNAPSVLFLVDRATIG